MSAVLSRRITLAFNEMAPQMKKAARWIVDNPREVALLSMREQARRAGVQPATMTRLAQHLNFSGFEDLRAEYADALRDGRDGLSGRAWDRLSAEQGQDEALFAAEALRILEKQIAVLMAPETLSSALAAVDRLCEARRIYCLGARSGHAVAWHLGYVLSLISDKPVLLDGLGSTGTDRLRSSGPEDALFVVSVQPYTRSVVEATNFARGRGVGVVALTDSAVSPLLREGDVAIVAPTASASFFHAMTPAFAMVELLASLVARRDGAASLEAVRRFDAHLAALGVYLTP